jgi:hypothetical protein
MSGRTKPWVPQIFHPVSVTRFELPDMLQLSCAHLDHSNRAPPSQRAYCPVDDIPTRVTCLKGSGSLGFHVGLSIDYRPKLLEAIARGAGVRVVTDLYDDSLSEGPPADSYLHLMRHDVTTIVTALR